MRILPPVAVAIVAAVTLAAPAHADENGFFQMLAARGAPATGDQRSALLRLGNTVCDGFNNGWSEQRAVSEIMKQLSDSNPNRAQLVVTSAHLQLCPDA